jgi:alanine dehydrogenase
MAESAASVTMTFLSGADVEACVLRNDEILTAITESLRAQGNGLTVIEPRVHLIPKSSADGHFNVLRGVFHPLGLAGNQGRR